MLNMVPDYFLIICEEDKSFCVVPAEDVVFRGHPKVDDDVKFYFNANEQEYSGKIINMAEGPDSYATLVKEQKKLSKRGDGENLFDPSKRRQAALKQREKMGEILKKSKKPSNDEEPTPKVPRMTIRNNIILDDTDDESASACESEKSGNRNSQQKDVTSVKDAADVQNQRPQTAATPHATPGTSGASGSHRGGRDEDNQRSFPNIADSIADIEEEELPDNRTQNKKTELRLKCSRKRRARRVKEGVNVNEIKFTGQMVRYTKANKDSKVIELYDNAGVFIKKSDLLDLRRTCNTTTKVARALMDAIFTDEALLECSLSGEVYTGSGAKGYAKRTPLDATVVAAIKEYTMKFAEKRGLPHHNDDVRISAAMRSKVTELRYAFRRNQEDERKQESNTTPGQEAAAQEAVLAAAEVAAIAAAEAAAVAAGLQGSGALNEERQQAIREVARKAARDAIARARGEECV